MAKITVPLLPQATEEYSQAQINQLIQSLEQMIFILDNVNIIIYLFTIK